MFRITVPSYHKRDDSGEIYTVFLVEVLECATGKISNIERRYSEFEELHKQLKKSMQTPEFPPKKINKWSNKVLEQRRVGLQNYLQIILQEDFLPKEVYTFLGANSIFGSQESINGIDADETLSTTHQPMVGFPADAFLQNCFQSSTRDVIIEGVHLGLYSNHLDELMYR